MKNKKINIFLIPSAIAVWIIVLFRIFSITAPSSDLPNSKSVLVVSDSNFISSDTLKLLLTYRDPFEIGNDFFKTNKRSINVIKQFSKPKEIKLPAIKYFGLIDNNNRSYDIALTFIADHSFLLSRGDTLLGLKVNALYQDSIIVIYQEKQFRIVKTLQTKL
jgi:hypothetical protein